MQKKKKKLYASQPCFAEVSCCNNVNTLAILLIYTEQSHGGNLDLISIFNESFVPAERLHFSRFFGSVSLCSHLSTRIQRPRQQ